MILLITFYMYIVLISIIFFYTGRIEYVQCSEVVHHSYSVCQKKAIRYPLNIINSISKTLHYGERSPNFQNNGKSYKYL